MKAVAFVVLVIFSMITAKANSAELDVASFEEMDRLVSAESPTREYLWCAVVSSDLGMIDVHELFLRKTARETDNGQALLMAYTYMMGFFKNEMLNAEGDDDLDDDQRAQVLAMLYKTTCLNHILSGGNKDE